MVPLTILFSLLAMDDIMGRCTGSSEIRGVRNGELKDTSKSRMEDADY